MTNRACSPRRPSLTERVRGPARPLFLLVAAGLLCAACGPGPERTESATQDGGAITRVELDADAGSVQLRRGPDGASQVQRTLRWTGETKPEYSQTTIGDTLKITARCPDDDSPCRTDLVVTVPASVSTRATVSTGELSVSGLTGAQELRASTGTINGSGLGAAPVTARTKTGEVRLRFAAAPPSIEADASTGNVEVRVPDGPRYQVQAEVKTGQAEVEIPDTAGAEHRISAGSKTGNVSVAHS